MMRVEAAIFAATEPLPRDALARLVGSSCNLDDLLADLTDELRARPYDLVFVAGGYQLRTKPRFKLFSTLPAKDNPDKSPVRAWGGSDRVQKVCKSRGQKISTSSAADRLNAFALVGRFRDRKLLLLFRDDPQNFAEPILALPRG